MALEDDLKTAAGRFFRESWDERDGTAVPDTDDVRLYNDGVNLDAVVLYADLAESTQLVNTYKATFAAEVYKAFLYCAARIIEHRGGVVTAYDGDRIMAVFLGEAKNSAAARAALNIHHAVDEIVMPAMRTQYPNEKYALGHCVGIDASKLLAARTGVRGANDLVWVGRAANYAAKLSALRIGGYRSIITAAVYNSLNEDSKLSADSVNMWTAIKSATLPGMSLYGSTWRWGV